MVEDNTEKILAEMILILLIKFQIYQSLSSKIEENFVTMKSVLYYSTQLYSI